ncbi:hypothetical protein COTS27_01326 [Spirochaetota bacterium]|nr:hypothetical protein COTS27_01326 [Spirochaetota bacterium]
MGSVIIFAYVVATASFGVAWIVYILRRNPAVVDLWWPLAILSVGVMFVYTGASTGNYRMIFLVLLLLWGGRLASYLLIARIIPNHRDSRYEAMAARAKRNVHVRFLFIYLFQAVLATLVSMALVGLFFAGGVIDLMFIGGVICYGIGMVGEIISDRQLNAFKRSASSQGITGAVCRVGLWKYSRHPNLFFEWIVWIGFAMLSTNAAYGLWAWVSPIVLLIVMLRLSIPLAEQESIKSRGDAFRDYQRSVSAFIPIPRKLF